MNPVVWTSQQGRRGTATRWEVAELAPVRNIRRPRVTKHQPRLSCTAEELAAASR